MADEIDIGSAAINRSYDVTVGGRTEINYYNPANLSGIIHTVQIYATNALTGVRVGTFEKLNGNVFKCRDSDTIGSVGSGYSSNTGLSITVVAGDYLGIYSAGAGEKIDKDVGLGDYFWYKVGEYIDPDDEATYELLTNAMCSLYGIGDLVVVGDGGVGNPALLLIAEGSL